MFQMPSGDTSLQFVTVGNPNNVADPSTGFGNVSYAFKMGKYDVTQAQYATFLNAVAKTDTYGLYDSFFMASNGWTFGIAQSGSPGSYSYAVTGTDVDKDNIPMCDVTWGDAARFCNWLQNGQPSGAEGNGTTETGAYTLSGATSQGELMAVARNPGATYFIPSENEWYKAAYYKGGGTNAGYWTYPTQSNTAPINTLPDTGNHANFFDYHDTGNGGYTDPVDYLTPVGDFALSPGPYGTYDMGGDVDQWTEKDINSLYRGLGGGPFNGYSDNLAASSDLYVSPWTYDNGIGFRVAAIPEPASIALLLAGGLCLLAYAWRRRRQAA